MQAMLPAGMPGNHDLRGRVRNGNGISEPISTSGFPGGVSSGCAQPVRQEHHRRNANAAADQQRARPFGVEHERPARWVPAR